jgi:hypothetical protein
VKLHLAPLVFVLFALFSFSQSSALPAAVSSLERISTEAYTNRPEILRALSDAPEAQGEAMRFLIENMPARDLKSLSAQYLLENLSLAYEAFNRSPWRDRIPKEILFNDVLPYASVDESRDSWRRKLFELASPLVVDCKTPSEAAQRLNQKLFLLTGVRYSTERRRANQGPLETLESRIATCTGLSILKVTVVETNTPAAKLEGTSRDESADLNDILSFNLGRERAYEIRVESNGRQSVRPFRSGTNSQELIVIPLIETPLLTLPSQVCYARPPLRAHLKPRDETRLEKALSDYFSARPEKQKEWKFSSGLEKLLLHNEPAVRQAAWNAYRRAPIHDSARQDFATNQVRFENEKDTLYGRYGRNLKFRAALEELRGQRTNIYPAAVQIIEGNGHTGLPDRDKIVDMYPAVRDPVPAELSWLMTDSVIRDFFWLRCDAPAKELAINATCEDNRLIVRTSANVTNPTVFLDQRLVDFAEPLAIEVNGQALKPMKVRTSLRVLCETLICRGDPELAFTARLDLPLNK